MSRLRWNWLIKFKNNDQHLDHFTKSSQRKHCTALVCVKKQDSSAFWSLDPFYGILWLIAYLQSTTFRLILNCNLLVTLGWVFSHTKCVPIKPTPAQCKKNWCNNYVTKLTKMVNIVEHVRCSKHIFKNHIFFFKMTPTWF